MEDSNTCNITVLGLNNNFYGSYSSNQTFFEEMMQAFRKSGIRVFTASTVEEAINIYETEEISFSFSFSKYQYYLDGIPLYDLFHVVNYQWISDNPLKMNLDVDSKWIKYIFIDDEYPLVLNKNAANGYLFRPLGYLEENLMACGKKNGRILIPCKIRNLNQIACHINESPWAELMKKFLDGYERNTSYIRALKSFFEKESITDYDEKEIIFRLTNEYTRVEKRLWAIEHTEEFQVDVLSEDCNNQIRNKRANFLPPVSYSMVRQLMNTYKYVINVDPNYHACIHDRFIKSVSSGTVCITNRNDLMDSINSITYSFDKPHSIMEGIYAAESEEGLFETQLNMIAPYSWEKSVQVLIDDVRNEGKTDEVSDQIYRKPEYSS